MSPDALRSAVGQRPAEAELEPSRRELAGLLGTAVEGVDDSARHVDAPQVLEQQVRRLPHMHDDRHVRLARDPQLLAEEPLLSCRIDAGLGEVDADLAHGDKTRIGERLLHGLAQPLDIVLDSVGKPQRMHSERVGKAMAMRNRAHFVALVHDARSG